MRTVYPSTLVSLFCAMYTLCEWQHYRYQYRY